MPTANQLQKEIDNLTAKNKELSLRVARIEESVFPKPEAKPEAEPADVKKAEAKRSDSLESSLGLKWISKIGILALVIGVGLFIKYAIDRDILSYTARILAGVVFGAGLCASGIILSRKQNYFVFGRTLAGGGISIAYFAVYAAYHFPDYRNAIGISQGLDIFFLSLVVLASIILSVRENSASILGESFILGYITSFLSTNLEIFTLVYGLILTLGLILCSVYKKWTSLGIGGVVFTYGLYFFWNIGHSASLAAMAFFLLVYFASFTAYTMLIKDDLKSIAITILNSIFFYLLAYAKVSADFPEAKGYFTLAFGLLYLMLNRRTLNRLKTVYEYLAIFYVTLAVPVQLDKGLVTLVWAFEAVLLFLLGRKLNSGTLLVSGHAVALFAVLKTLFYDTFFLEAFSFADILQSTRALSYMCTIIALYIISSRQGKGWSAAYSSAAVFLASLLVLLEVRDYWISVAWGLMATGLLFLGITRVKTEYRVQGLVIFGFTVLKVFLYDTRGLDVLYRTVSFIVLGALLLFVSVLYTRYKDRFLPG